MCPSSAPLKVICPHRGLLFLMEAYFAFSHHWEVLILNYLPRGLALSLRSALYPPPGRPFGVEHQPPLFNSFFQDMTSRGLLVLDSPPSLGVSCTEQGPKYDREPQMGPEQPQVSRTAWLETFSLSVACVGTELAPPPLPVSVSRPVLPQCLHLIAGSALSRH